MNDNLRNISLQYIKGENYEKITCFYSTDITKIKQILKLDYKEKNYNILEDILKKDKHEIGESLLDDLINYISFKDLKDTIKEAINEKKALLKDKKDEKDANDKMIKINSFLNKLNELNKISKDMEVPQQTGEDVDVEQPEKDMEVPQQTGEDVDVEQPEKDMEVPQQTGEVVDVKQQNKKILVILNLLKKLYVTDNKLNKK